MDISLLIKKLQEMEQAGIKNVCILNSESDSETRDFCSNDIIGVSYYFGEDTCLLIPEYL